MSEKTENHIHHAMCGHGGERVIRDSDDYEICKVDGYESTTKMVYQYYGCKWHGCKCQKKDRNVERYEKTLRLEEFVRAQGYNVISVWECAKPPKKWMRLEKEFIPYPHYVVFDFEALLKVLNECRTTEQCRANSCECSDSRYSRRQAKQIKIIKLFIQVTDYKSLIICL